MFLHSNISNSILLLLKLFHRHSKGVYHWVSTRFYVITMS